MHNSGTSLLTESLARLGVAFGPALVRRGHPGNGAIYDYWEDADIVAAQEGLLHRLDRHWRSCTATLPIGDWHGTAAIAGRGALRDLLRQRLAVNPGLWGFKDPRTARLLPLWRQVFADAGVEPWYVISLRSPEATAASFAAKAEVPVSWAEALWRRTYLYILEGTAGQRRCLVDYAEWTAAPQLALARLTEFLGLPMPQDAAVLNAVRGELAGHARPAAEVSEASRSLYARLGRLRDGSADEAGIATAAPPPPAEGTPPEPSLAGDAPGTQDDEPRRICLVTAEISGSVPTGGIGTATGHLAQTLADAGHAVTLLYAGEMAVPGPEIEAWRRRGITFVPLPPALLPPGPRPSAVAYAVFRWLHDRAFDVIHYHDWLGIGYFLTGAKRSGLAFAATTLCCTVHGPTRWATHEQVEALDALEREAIAGADLLICSSAAIRDWLIDHGWPLPQRWVIQQNLIPVPPDRPPPGEVVQPGELVFFGRLEARKGVVLFCDALGKLGDRTVPVTFLGGNTPTLDGDTAAYIRRRAAALGQSWRIVDTLGRTEALAYLRQPGRVAVIPSLFDNSPSAVLECLVEGIPLIAAATGGIPELIAAADHATALCEATSDSLADRLAKTLRDGLRPARPRLDPLRNRVLWLDWHRRVPRAAAAVPAWTGTGEAAADRCSVVRAGVSTTQPSRATIAAGTHDSCVLPDDAPLLGLWMLARTVDAGDLIRLRLSDPAGRPLIALERPVNHPPDTLLVFQGLPRPATGWLPGRYWAEWTVTSPACGWSASLNRWITVGSANG
jgi:glycosyltransferase involved in cell wall biosynthesis